MDLTSRLFPYPVLSKYNNDYLNSEFDILLEKKVNKHQIEIYGKVRINDECIIDLVENKLATYALFMECSQTSFRKLIKSSELTIRVNINPGSVNNKINIVPLVIAMQDIEQYSNPNFNDIYYDLTFDIEKHNIIAIGQSAVIDIIKDYDEIRNIKSIFSIVPLLNNENYVKWRQETRKIVIEIPKDQYNDYKIAIKNPKNNPSIYSSLVISILVNIFESIKNGNWDEYEDTLWFKAVQKALEKKGIEFNMDNIQDFDSFKNAQLILDSPILAALTNMNCFMMEDEDDSN